ncbi:MAG TPA: hypothetical protein PLE35_04805, partial [Lentisphaeria bacterium]|nr:hypothetical protein [Lentisphaeria bacterium]
PKGICLLPTSCSYQQKHAAIAFATSSRPLYRSWKQGYQLVHARRAQQDKFLAGARLELGTTA